MWPDERPTWTAGAVLLAIDALYRLTDACALFTSDSLLRNSAATQYAKRERRR